jgi:Flp pilus assembly protein TadG
MKNMLASLFQAARRDDGVAAVEFALLLPVMLLVYVGAMEASALIAMDRRVQSVTGALGDLVAQSNAVLREEDLQDYFLAASGIMTPYPSGGLQQVVTLVSVDDDGSTEIEWSYQYIDGTFAEGVRHSTGDSFELPQAMINVATDGFVIVAESGYSYTPLFGIVFDQPINLYRENFYMTRFGDSIVIN